MAIMKTLTKLSSHSLKLCLYEKLLKIKYESIADKEARLVWRRVRDSNPRNGFPLTPLAGERLQPLGQLSTFVIYCFFHSNSLIVKNFIVK